MGLGASNRVLRHLLLRLGCRIHPLYGVSLAVIPCPRETVVHIQTVSVIRYVVCYGDVIDRSLLLLGG